MLAVEKFIFNTGKAMGYVFIPERMAFFRIRKII